MEDLLIMVEPVLHRPIYLITEDEFAVLFPEEVAEW